MLFEPRCRVGSSSLMPGRYTTSNWARQQLPALFDKVFVPAIVREELRHIEAPAVRKGLGGKSAELA